MQDVSNSSPSCRSLQLLFEVSRMLDFGQVFCNHGLRYARTTQALRRAENFGRLEVQGLRVWGLGVYGLRV